MSYEKLCEKLLEDMKREFKGGEYLRTTCSENSPLYQFIQDQHEGFLPQDWIFSKVYDLLASLGSSKVEDQEGLRDEVAGFADSLTDIYNHELLDWCKCFYHHIDEAVSDFGYEAGPDFTFMDLVRMGQCRQLDSMGHALVDFLAEQKEANHE